MNHLLAEGLRAQRVLLLMTLRLTGWNLSHTARVLGLQDGSDARRKIRQLGLAREYERAVKARAVRPGRPAVRGVR